MIAFDTNVLLRLLLNDDSDQAKRAQDLIDHAVSASDRVLLPDIVLCELEWVLESVYQFPRAGIARTLRRLLDAQEFAFMNRAAVRQALDSYTRGQADFSDYLIGESATLAGATTTYTFDRVLSRSTGFSRPR